jgi:uncharacterized protein DUF6152
VIRSTLQTLLGAAAAVVACVPADAHHSYAQYDTCTRVSFEGEITGIEWANPHVRISLAIGHDEAYSFEWSSLQQLNTMGVPTGQLRTGDRVVITGSENRDPAVKIVTLLTEIRRPSDGWTWMRDRPIPERCTQR